MRGSIPTFWTQESAIAVPKPPIVNSRVDPMYSATQVKYFIFLIIMGNYYPSRVGFYKLKTERGKTLNTLRVRFLAILSI